MAFAPAAVALHRARPEGGSPRNCWSGRIVSVEGHGDVVRVALREACRSSPTSRRWPSPTSRSAPGGEVWASVKATETSVYPA